MLPVSSHHFVWWAITPTVDSHATSAGAARVGLKIVLKPRGASTEVPAHIIVTD